MKYKLLLLLCLLGVSWSCKDPEPAIVNLVLSSDALGIGPDGGTLTFEITCNTSWRIEGAPAWCTPDKTGGKGGATITLKISAYEAQSGNRTATLNVSAGSTVKSLTLTQNPSLESYRYELPVIFHVIQGPGSESIRNGWIREMINACNANYLGLGGNSPDMNLEFVLADKKPDGTRLDEPGLEYISWSSETIDVNEFMADKNVNPAFIAMLWDLNKYINVFIYDFGDENAGTTGIAFLPYGISTKKLDGLYDGDVYLTRYPKYVHCVSLNRRYLYERSTDTHYNSEDVTATLSHELGHYLGLYHAFSQTQCGGNDDYCADTPDYNRANYESWLDNLLDNTTESSIKMATVAAREACDGTKFTSYNIMDYYFGYTDQFTEEQAKRVRYVLSYSPLIPGPKYRTGSKSAQDFEIPPATLMR